MGNKKTRKGRQESPDVVVAEVQEKKKESKPVVQSRRSDVDQIRLKMLKQFGENAVISGEDMEKANFGRISTGSLTLDLALGGGIPVGRIIQLAGHKSSSKSSLASHIVRNAQQHTIEWTHTRRKEERGREVVSEEPRKIEGLIVAYSDVEGTQTQEWLEQIGVDVPNLIYTAPSSLEEGLEMLHQMQEDGVNLIILDSIDALEPMKRHDTPIGETVQMGIKPIVMGEFLRKFNATNNLLVRQGKLPCTLIMLNQLREKIGAYGNPEYAPGGKAIDFYISLDVRLRRGDWIALGTGDNKEFIGQVVKFKVEKNKTYKQQQTGEFDFYFADGGTAPAGHVDTFKEIVIEGIAYGIIEKAGSWLKYKGENLAQGADNTVALLRDNPQIFNQIKQELFSLVLADVDHKTGGE